MALRGYGNFNYRLLPETARYRQKRQGLTEGEASFEIQAYNRGASACQSLASILPNINSAHPLASFLICETREIIHIPQGLRAECRYAGAADDDLDRPVYSLVIGEEEMPIETHPKFFSHIAGKPSSPLNGALFVDGEGSLTASDLIGLFAGFATSLVVSGTLARNPFAGIDAYMDAVNITWRQRYTTRRTPNDLDNVGLIMAPEGPAPRFSENRNWRYCGYSADLRGLRTLTPVLASLLANDTRVVYDIARDWKLSGRGGWNTTIYND